MNLKNVAVVIFIRDLTREGVSLWMQPRDSRDQTNGLLEFPGGKLEFGERAAQAAVREVKEELGIDVSKDELLLFRNSLNQFNGQNYLVHYFLGRGERSDLASEGYLYFPFGEGRINFPVLEPNKIVLLELLNYLQERVDRPEEANLWE